MNTEPKPETTAQMLLSILQNELSVAEGAAASGCQMDEREREFHKGAAFGIKTCMTRIAQQESAVPTSSADWQSYALMLRLVLERGYNSLASAAMCQTKDGEAAWTAMGDALKEPLPGDAIESLLAEDSTSAVQSDSHLSDLLEHLRKSRSDRAVLFDHSEYYLAKKAVTDYVAHVVEREVTAASTSQHAALVNLCAAYRWRTDGDCAVLISRINHHIRELRASVKAHHALLDLRRQTPVSISIDTAAFRQLVEKFIAWRDSGMDGPNPYLEMVSYINDFKAKL